MVPLTTCARGTALACLLAAALLAGCGEDGSDDAATAPAVTEAAAATPSPAAANAVVTSFYGDYARSYGGSLTSPGEGSSPPDSEAIRARAVGDHGTERLAQAVSAARDFDAALCAQNVPAAITIGEGVVRGEKVEVVTEHSYDGSPLRVKAIVVATPGGAKIDEIVCP